MSSREDNKCRPSLRSPETAAFADFWYEARERADAMLPCKDDFLTHAFARFMPQIALTEANADGIPCFVLFGTGLVKDLGRDLTGCTVLDHMTEEAVGQMLESFASVPDTPEDRRNHGRWGVGRGISSSGRHVEFESLTFPYHAPRSAGSRHITCIHVLDTLTYDEGVITRFPEVEMAVFDGRTARPDWMYLRESEPVTD